LTSKRFNAKTLKKNSEI